MLSRISLMTMMRLVRGLRSGTSTSVHCQPSSMISSLGGVPPSDKVFNPSCNPASKHQLVSATPFLLDKFLFSVILSLATHAQPPDMQQPQKESLCVRGRGTRRTAMLHLLLACSNMISALLRLLRLSAALYARVLGHLNEAP